MLEFLILILSKSVEKFLSSVFMTGATDLVVFLVIAYALTESEFCLHYQGAANACKIQDEILDVSWGFRTEGSQTDLRVKAISFSALVSDNLVLNNKYFFNVKQFK